MSEQETKTRPMLVSERLEMRLQGSPETENNKGYTMYPNWQLQMEIADVKALEAELEATQYGLAMTQHYWISPMEYEEDRVKWSKRVEGLEEAVLLAQLFLGDLRPSAEDVDEITQGRIDQFIELTNTLAAEADLSKLTTQQKPTEEAMEET